MGGTIKVGSRESVLAVRQAEIVMEAVRKNNPDIKFESVKIKTTGDKILGKSLDKIGGKGLFVKELELALANRAIDIAVHSYKDMPFDVNPELPVVALSERETPFDALILPADSGAGSKTGGYARILKSDGVSPLPFIDGTKPMGSSSLRRSVQFKSLYSGIEVAPVRGNVATRIEKLDRGEYCAVILAVAGLVRLNLRDRISRVFADCEMLPAASQGIIAVQGRAGEDYSYLEGFHCASSELVSKAERGFVAVLGGGCNSPAAAYAEIKGGEIKLTGMVSDGARVEKAHTVGYIESCERMGYELAERMRLW